MKQIVRFLIICGFSLFLFSLGTFGWIGMCEKLAVVLPASAPITSNSTVRMLGLVVGLGLVLVPFYTITYFHQTKQREVFGFKTPKGGTKAEHQ